MPEEDLASDKLGPQISTYAQSAGVGTLAPLPLLVLAGGLQCIVPSLLTLPDRLLKDFLGGEGG